MASCRCFAARISAASPRPTALSDPPLPAPPRPAPTSAPSVRPAGGWGLNRFQPPCQMAAPSHGSWDAAGDYRPEPPARGRTTRRSLAAQVHRLITGISAPWQPHYFILPAFSNSHPVDGCPALSEGGDRHRSGVHAARPHRATIGTSGRRQAPFGILSEFGPIACSARASRPVAACTGLPTIAWGGCAIVENVPRDLHRHDRARHPPALVPRQVHAVAAGFVDNARWGLRRYDRAPPRHRGADGCMG